MKKLRLLFLALFLTVLGACGSDPFDEVSKDTSKKAPVSKSTTDGGITSEETPTGPD